MDTQLPETVPLHVRIENDLDQELRETMVREDRDKTTITKRALRDYIARSKAEAVKPSNGGRKAERA